MGMGKCYFGLSIRADSLIPCQIRCKRNFRIATDYYVARLLKHNDVSEFHSQAELYHAALLEGDPDVTRYVPQPFRVYICDKPYIPDCYIARDGATEVIELKPRGEYDERRRTALEAFFSDHRMAFKVLANEAVFHRQTEARNWLSIVRTLLRYPNIDTAKLEYDLLSLLAESGPYELGSFLVPLDRASTLPTEVALFRLLHRGAIQANLQESVLGFGTELELRRALA